MNLTEKDMVIDLTERFVNDAEAGNIEDFLTRHGGTLPYGATTTVLKKYFGIEIGRTLVMMPMSPAVVDAVHNDPDVDWQLVLYKIDGVPYTPLHIAGVDTDKGLLDIEFLSWEGTGQKSPPIYRFNFEESEHDGVTAGIFEFFLIDHPIISHQNITLEEAYE